MANGIDLSALTLNPVESEDIKDFIIERVFERSSRRTKRNGKRSNHDDW